MNPIKETPLMKQYALFKKKYPGAILLFRVGDFYETFGDDAIKASKILSITLTKRSNGGAADMPLAGFPHHRQCIPRWGDAATHLFIEHLSGCSCGLRGAAGREPPFQPRQRLGGRTG